MRYLELVATRDETTPSGAFRAILAEHAVTVDAAKPTQKARRHFIIQPSDVEALNRLTVAWGLSKCDVARRLIDAAIEAERAG